MKTTRNIIASVTTAVLMTGLALSFNSCSEQSPFSHLEKQATDQISSGGSTQSMLDKGPLSEAQLNAITAPKEKIEVAENDLKILKSKSGVSLQKHFVTSWYVAAGATGWIYTGDDEHGRCWLHFSSGALNQNAIITLDWESTGFLEGGAEFNPHGLQFNEPVTLWISYKDADLGDVAEENLKIWYFNEDTGMWELIGDVVDTEHKVVGGLLHHFSRYAIGGGP
jgi:hypothetical protein